MKKILHISKFYPPYYGGIEDVVYNIVSEFRNSAYEQRVICFNHEKGGTIRTNENGIGIVRVKTPFTIASQPISLSYLWQLKKELQTFKPDIIHVHFPNPLIAVYLLLLSLHHIKVIIHWHADIIGKNMLYWTIKPFERRALQRADVIITTSEQYIELSKPLLPFKDKIRILPNTINEEKLQLQPGDNDTIAHIRSRYNGKKIVFFVGRHVPYKGIDLLIKATRYLPENCVVVIGSTGEQTAYLQELAQPYGEKIQFVGRLTDTEMRCYLYAADIFAFPSIDRREAFGVALAEALYCGTPAVTFRINGSGVTWVNQDKKTGIIVDEIDEKHYAEALNVLLADEALRIQYGQTAQEWVRAHFLKNRIDSLSELYDQC